MCSGYFSYPSISLAEIVAGAPFFFDGLAGVAVGWADSLGPAVGLGFGEDDGDSSGDGLGVAGPLCFFFFVEAVAEGSGDGVTDGFFFFAVAEGDDSGAEPGDDFLFGEADFSGEAVGFGVGDFSALAFFLVCLRGAGVGVGAKIFFKLVPNESSAGARAAKPAIAATETTATAALIQYRMVELTSLPAPPARPCSAECRPPNFRAGNFRWANGRGNRATPVPSVTFRLPECRGIGRRSGWRRPPG